MRDDGQLDERSVIHLPSLMKPLRARLDAGVLCWSLTGGKPAPRPRRTRTAGRGSVMTQDLVFEKDDVRITRHVALFGQTSYQIASIGSVRIGRTTKANRLAIAAAVAGCAVLILAFLEQRQDVAIAGGVILLVAALLQLAWPRRQYILILNTPGGDVDAFISPQARPGDTGQGSHRKRIPCACRLTGPGSLGRDLPCAIGAAAPSNWTPQGERLPWGV